MNEIALIEGELELEPHVEAALAPRAERIRSLVNVARSCIIEVGRELIEAKGDVPHGQWLPWLRHEFQWSHDTAANYIRVAEAFQISNSSEFPTFNISARALYALAAPGIPQTVRDAAAQAAAEGGQITEAEAEKLIAEHVAKALEAQREELDVTLHEREDEYLGRIEALKGDVAALTADLEAPPTIEDAVEMFRQLTGKRKLSARQYQALALALGKPISDGRRIYPPATEAESREAEAKLDLHSNLGPVKWAFGTSTFAQWF